MDKKDFFVKENHVVDFNIFGEIFKYKKVTADDELDWVKDYTEKYEEKGELGEVVKKTRTNLKKLGKCKLRNIVEVPFTKEELKLICRIDKEYINFTNEEKDKMFGRLSPKIFDMLIKKINNDRGNQKKN